MSDITNTFNAAKISEGDAKGSSVEISIRRFCGSLARRLHPWRKTRAQEEVAPANASAQTGSPMQLPINRIIKHGRFDWGSFSAFEDGSIEVEDSWHEAVVSKLFRVGGWAKIQRTEMMG